MSGRSSRADGSNTAKEDPKQVVQHAAESEEEVSSMQDFLITAACRSEKSPDKDFYISFWAKEIKNTLKDAGERVRAMHGAGAWVDKLWFTKWKNLDEKPVLIFPPTQSPVPPLIDFAEEFRKKLRKPGPASGPSKRRALALIASTPAVAPVAATETTKPRVRPLSEDRKAARKAAREAKALANAPHREYQLVWARSADDPKEA